MDVLFEYINDDNNIRDGSLNHQRTKLVPKSIWKKIHEIKNFFKI